MDANFWNWFTTYPQGVGLAPWEYAWYAMIYVAIGVALWVTK